LILVDVVVYFSYFDKQNHLETMPSLQFPYFDVKIPNFWQGRISVATAVTKVISFNFKCVNDHSFYEQFWALPWLLGHRKFYELTLNVRVDNPLRYVSHCQTARVLSEDNQICTIYIYPIFSSTTTENFEASFTLKFEAAESSAIQYKFVLLNQTGGECWTSDIISESQDV